MSSQAISFNDLPIDILCRVFSKYLDFESKLKAELVCHQWQDIVRKAFLVESALIISDHDIHETRFYCETMKSCSVSVVNISKKPERNENIDRDSISIVISKYVNLRALCVSLRYTRCKSHILDAIAQRDNKQLSLLRIEMSDCTTNGRVVIVAHDEVLNACEKFPNLSYFYVDFVNLYLSENSLEVMFHAWPKLETFVLRSQCLRTNSAVYNSEIEYTSGTTVFSGEYFSAISNNLVNLEAPGNVLNNNAVLRLPQLKLDKLVVYRFNINTMDDISARFQSISCLGLSVDNNINVEELYGLMEGIGKLRNLSDLYLTVAIDIQISNICVKFLKNCDQLRRLQFFQTALSRESIEAMARYLPALRALEIWTSGLNQNTCVRDDVVEAIQSLQQLRLLNLRGQRFVSDSTIAEIIAGCKQLTFIDLRNTKAAVLTLKECVERVRHTEHKLEVMIHESTISRMFTVDTRRVEFLDHLVLNNVEYDYKVGNFI